MDTIVDLGYSKETAERALKEIEVILYLLQARENGGNAELIGTKFETDTKPVLLTLPKFVWDVLKAAPHFDLAPKTEGFEIFITTIVYVGTAILADQKNFLGLIAKLAEIMPKPLQENPSKSFGFKENSEGISSDLDKSISSEARKE